MMYVLCALAGAVSGAIMMALYAYVTFTTRFQKLGADVMREMANIKAKL